MKSNRTIALIVNPNAGRKQGRHIAEYVTDRLAKAGIPARTFVSEEPGGTRRIAEELNPAEWEGVVVIGGDGSLFEVINGLSRSGADIPVPVGQIPSGTGNSFVKDLGVNTADDAVDIIVAGDICRVDAGRLTCEAGEYRFLNMLGAGFVSNVSRRSCKYKRFLGAELWTSKRGSKGGSHKIFGTMSYLLGTIDELIRLDPVEISLEIDGTTIERRALFVEICNSRYTGGDMMMAPSARIGDGLLDVIMVNAVTRRRVLALLPTIFSGNHVKAPEVEVFQGRNIRLESRRPMALTPDGENFGTTPISVGIEPGAVRMYGRPNDG